MDVSTLFDVKDKVVLVTGGAKGIGRMISEGFVQNGAKVYISSRDAKACEQACKELNALGKGSAYAIPANFYKEEDCKQLAQELGKREKKLHILVNNSGSNWGESYDTYPDSAWTRVLTLNLHRVFTITQLLTPLLENAATAEDPARIINIGSIDGLRVPSLETFAYSASKAGLHHLSRVLANHLGRRHITSNTLACGPFESKMMAATLKKFRDVIEGQTTLGRIGTPQDVAGACLFLGSMAGAWVNGATIALGLIKLVFPYTQKLFKYEKRGRKLVSSQYFASYFQNIREEVSAAIPQRLVSYCPCRTPESELRRNFAEFRSVARAIARTPIPNESLPRIECRY